MKISRRRLIQLLSAAAQNANFRGFLNGSIYKGASKGVCVPGLNCYSCPGAVGACPLGSLQTSFSPLGRLPLYIIGTFLVFGALFGRAVCAFLCPFGLVQELLHKIPSSKIGKSVLTRRLSLLKYVVLAVFVFLLPVYFLLSSGVAVPAFCKYVCPAGTLEGGIPLVLANEGLRAMIGALFNWKLFILALVILCSVFMYRFFCRFLCPLGAIYSFFNRYAAIGAEVSGELCVNCGKCSQACKMDVLRINDRECLRCGDCRSTCQKGAVRFCAFGKEIK